jgi:RimJ/RimL family protein N-acetyltransferase
MVEADLNWASCGLGPGDVNLSYQVYPWAQGQHFAQRAVHLVCAWLPTATTATTAVLWVEPANTASLRVAERGGFADCGLFTTSDGDRYRYYRYNLGKQRSQASA